MTTPTKPTLPCAFDPRPLRITLFPEHPQTILIYVPEGQALWLPTLPTPFDLDVVCDALDAHDVPHDTREGDRNRWWRNLKEPEDEEKSVRVQRQREDEAARHVQVHLSPTASTSDKQRSEIMLMKHKVDDEIRQLKVQIGRAKAAAATRGIYEALNVFRSREQRLADLQTTSLALQRKLAEMKALRRQNAESRHREGPRSREEIFINKAKRYLTRDEFMSIWAEIEAEEATRSNECTDASTTAGTARPR
jgi:hypothetical protein